jgi:hypothetical protein
MIAGLVTFGASYALTALVGLELASGDATSPGTYCTNCDSAPLLLIPLAGPWIFLPDADGGDGKAVSAILGVAQATGLVLSIWGIAKFMNSAPADQARAMPRLMLGVAPTPHGAYSSMHLRF